MTSLLNKFGVKYTFKDLIGYQIAAYVIKIVLILAFIYQSIEPFTMFVDHLQAFLNDEAKIDLYFMLWKVLWIVGYYFIVVLIETFVAFVIILPMAKKTIEDKNRIRW